MIRSHSEVRPLASFEALEVDTAQINGIPGSPTVVGAGQDPRRRIRMGHPYGDPLLVGQTRTLLLQKFLEKSWAVLSPTSEVHAWKCP